MKICIITHVQHIKQNDQYFGYAPYIREMNIWLKYADEVIVVAPLVDNELNPIYEKYSHSKISFCEAAEFEITSFANVFKTLIKLPEIFSSVYKAMSQADHIHLRCPGNMGLVGAIVQIFFPKKLKTAKYAGNWDPKAKQPFTYKLQRWILSKTFLTKNMQVLVYGDWENQTQNIKPFFTATYSENEIHDTVSIFRSPNFKNGIRFIFVGTLSSGKQPLYALKLVHELVKRGFDACIDFYGEGNQQEFLSNYIQSNHLSEVAILKGNQTRDAVKHAYKEGHFLILPSKSEGWPKVIAESMFWGCVPLASPISCVPFMIGNGSRGILLEERLTDDILQIIKLINDEALFRKMSFEGQSWSRQYTTEKFENEISNLL